MARHKSRFFIEKDTSGRIIDYLRATEGHLDMVPKGEALDALAQDYAAMQADDILIGNSLAFEDLMQACSELETRINRIRTKAL